MLQRYQSFETMATIDENAKEYRNKLGLTQDDLVRKSGVRHTALTKIEGGFVQKPSVQVIVKFAKALEVSIEDLLKLKSRKLFILNERKRGEKYENNCEKEFCVPRRDKETLSEGSH